MFPAPDGSSATRTDRTFHDRSPSLGRGHRVERLTPSRRGRRTTGGWRQHGTPASSEKRHQCSWAAALAMGRVEWRGAGVSRGLRPQIVGCGHRVTRSAPTPRPRRTRTSAPSRSGTTVRDLEQPGTSFHRRFRRETVHTPRWAGAITHRCERRRATGGGAGTGSRHRVGRIHAEGDGRRIRTKRIVST